MNLAWIGVSFGGRFFARECVLESADGARVTVTTMARTTPRIRRVWRFRRPRTPPSAARARANPPPLVHARQVACQPNCAESATPSLLFRERGPVSDTGAGRAAGSPPRIDRLAVRARSFAEIT